MALNESSIITDICDGTKVMKEFFSDVCVVDHRNGDPVRACFDSEGYYQFYILTLSSIYFY